MSTSSKVRNRIDAILADVSFDDPACEDGRDDLILPLVAQFGWQAVRDEMLALLADDGARRHWSTAAIVIWRSIDLPMPAVRVIALLHRCQTVDLPVEPALDENLVWSITCNLKGVDYLSDYDPANDPDVRVELLRLRAT